MSGIQNLINAQIMMFLFLGVGFLCRKLNYTDTETENKLSAAITNIVLPCMIFDAMLETLGDKAISEVLLVVVICVAVVLCSYWIGWLLYRKTAKDKRPVFIYSIMTSNFAFVGLPIIAAVYGENGIFYAAIYMTVCRLFVWTLGLDLFIQGRNSRVLSRIVTNPNNIAVAFAVAVHFSGISLPGPIYGVVEEIGSTSTLLCMVMIGSLIAGNIHWKKLLSVSAYGYSAVRLIGIPLLTFAILRLLRVDPVITGSVVILVSAPAPTLACIMATRYGADKELAAVLVLVSTLLSFITQPIMAMLCK